MTSFTLERWDAGRLTVNIAFADLLRRHGWNTFETIWNQTAAASVAKNLRADRVTLRFTLDDHGRERVFYIKRHRQSSWQEYVKPLLRLTWPILGARNEWRAILKFHEVDIPTMTPVALGESGSDSFLVTAALEHCTKLSDINRRQPELPNASTQRLKFVEQVAQLARQMHQSGLHHQDFYLGHLMQSDSNPDLIYVIDLGRVGHSSRLARRWIVKDLAQLKYSAQASPREELRFLKSYLGRPLERSDRRLIADIAAKANAIGRHTRKNKL